MYMCSGCSCSGKTTLAKVLKQILPNTTIIHQDKFYKLDRLIPKDPDTGYDNWDTPQAIDMTLFLDTIKGAINSPSIAPELENPDQEIVAAANYVAHQLGSEVLSQLHSSNDTTRPRYFIIIEGFLYFHDPTFLRLLDGAVLAWADYPSLLARRLARPGYETKEGFWADPPHYFEKVVWPSFLHYYHPFLKQNHVGKTPNTKLETDTVSPLPSNAIQQIGLNWESKYHVVRTDKEMTLPRSALEIMRHLLQWL